MLWLEMLVRVADDRTNLAGVNTIRTGWCSERTKHRLRHETALLVIETHKMTECQTNHATASHVSKVVFELF
jgi:hypothetical protein